MSKDILGIDLKKFKHIRSDDKSTTLQHSDGHTMTIAHSVLSPKTQEMFKALAKSSKEEPKKMANGGEASDQYAHNPVPNKDARDLPSHPENNTIVDRNKSHPNYETHAPESNAPEFAPEENQAQLEAKGGRIQYNGNPNKPDDDLGTRDNFQSQQGKDVERKEYHHAKSEAKGRAEMERHIKPNIKGLAQGGSVQKYAEGEEVTKDTPEDPQSAQDAVGKAINLTINTGSSPQPQAQGAPAVSPEPPPWLQQDPSVKPPEEPKAMPEAPASDAPPVQASQRAPAPAHIAPAPQQMPPVAAPLPPDVASQPPEYQKAYADAKQARQQDFAKENVAFAQDLANGHITPKTYSDLFHDRSTLGKIGMIFGLMLSGAGAGISHQQNAYLGMMDKVIANDLEAQKQSKVNAQNYLKTNQQAIMNQAQVKNLNTQQQAEAYALAQSQMLQASFHNQVDRVNKMPEGPMKEKAKAALGIMYNAVGARINNIGDAMSGASAYSDALFGGNQGTSNEQGFQKRVQGLKSGIYGPAGSAIGNDLEAKHFPGIEGAASRPLNGSDHDYLQGATSFQSQLNDFIDWTKKHSGDLNPKDIKEGRAKAADLQGAYRKATQGGVYKEGEQNFIGKLIDSDPTKFFNNIRVLPSLKAISDDNKNKINNYAKNLGFSGYTDPNEGAEASEIRKFDPRTSKTHVFDAKTKKYLRTE